MGERVAALGEELAAARRDRAAVEGRSAGLRTRRTELGYSEAEHKAARDAAVAIERERREAEVALARAKGESGAAAEAVAAAERRRAEWTAREREAAATARDLALHQELDRALSDLRGELNATLRPDLSDLASSFLRDLTHGRYSELELNEDYGTTLLEDGDPKAVISGGEEDIANLALRLAISQMIAERAGQPLSLLVLDEIFGSLDEDRRHRGRGSAPQSRRPLPPGHPHHPHRFGARRVRSGDSRGARPHPRRRDGPGRAAGGTRCGGLTEACGARIVPATGTSIR